MRVSLGRSAVRHGLQVLVSVIISLVLILFLWAFLRLPLGKTFSATVTRNLSGFLLCAGLAWVIFARQSGARQSANRWQRRHRSAQVLGFVLCVGACTLPIVATWSNSSWGYSKIGGVLPWSDARDYFTGAYSLANHEDLGSWNSRRPLNALLLASRLFLGGGSFYRAVLLQGALLGACAFLYLRELRRLVPGGSVLVAGAIIYTFTKPYLDIVLSESLGISLGLVAGAALLRFASSGNGRFYFLSLIGFSFALSARSGPYVILLLLVFLAPFLLGTSAGARSKNLIAAISCSLSGGLYSMVLNMLYGVAGTGQSSNFSYTLYGIAKGGLGWTAYQTDFAGVAYSTEVELSRAVFKAALRSIISDPLLFLKGLAEGFGGYFEVGIFGFAPGLLGAIFFALFAVGLTVLSLNVGLRRLRLTTLSGIVGLLLSIPFIFEDGGFRVTAVALPFLVVPPVLACAFFAQRSHVDTPFSLKVEQTANQPRLGLRTSPRSRAFCITALGLAVFALITTLPLWGDIGIVGKQVAQAGNCSTDEVAMTVELGPNQPAILVLDTANSGRGFGVQSLDHYQTQAPINGIEISVALSQVPPNSYLVETVRQDLEIVTSVFLIFRPELMPMSPALVHLCASPVPDEIGAQYGIFEVSSMKRDE